MEALELEKCNTENSMRYQKMNGISKEFLVGAALLGLDDF